MWDSESNHLCNCPKTNLETVTATSPRVWGIKYPGSVFILLNTIFIRVHVYIRMKQYVWMRSDRLKMGAAVLFWECVLLNLSQSNLHCVFRCHSWASCPYVSSLYPDNASSCSLPCSSPASMTGSPTKLQCSSASVFTSTSILPCDYWQAPFCGETAIWQVHSGNK